MISKMVMVKRAVMAAFITSGALLCMGLLIGCENAGGYVESEEHQSAGETEAVSATEPDETLVAEPMQTTGPVTPHESEGVSSSEIPEQAETPKIVTDAEADDFFNDSVFVGDSIMEGLAQYVLAQRKNEPTLGDAKFLTTVNGIKLADCAGDMGDKTEYYMYKGSQRTVSQCIGDMGVSKVFIMLGTNDLGVGYGVAETVERYSRTIDIISETSPHVEIFIELNTPRNASSWLPSYITNKSFGNPLIDEFVNAVRIMCESRGLCYIDLNAALKDENNALPEEFCRDGFDHINNAGAAVVVEALREFAKDVLS
ncbi:MAG: GDSL-type esterase/lipase family protein [Oscillospiraceae bacterium]|jgi:lysophospholipase L1-like esterase|nr:GDSL-type esterase/lipase family protein [Oscillospiraceae bacterium]